MVMLNHSEAKDALTWCRDRNHSGREVPEQLIARLEQAQASFPRGRPIPEIMNWWKSDALEVSDEELRLILDCVYTNTAMEDAHLPKWAVEKQRMLEEKEGKDGDL